MCKEKHDAHIWLSDEERDQANDGPKDVYASVIIGVLNNVFCAHSGIEKGRQEDCQKVEQPDIKASSWIRNFISMYNIGICLCL